MNTISAGKQILLLFIYILIGLLLVSLSFALYTIYTAESIDGLLNSATLNSKELSFIRFSLLLNHLGILILPALAFAFYPKNELLNGLFRLKNFPSSGKIWYPVLISLAALPLISYLGFLNQEISFPSYLAEFEQTLKNLEEQGTEVTTILLKPNAFKDLLFNLFLMALIPAIGEEMIFRGIIQPNLISITNNKFLGVLITAAVFSAMHMQFYGFFPRFFIGFFIGYLVLIKNNLWYGILAHFTNNAFLVILVWYNTRYLGLNIEEVISENDFDQDNSEFLVLASLIVTAFLFYKLINVKK